MNIILGVTAGAATLAVLGAIINVFAAYTTSRHKVEPLYEAGVGALGGLFIAGVLATFFTGAWVVVGLFTGTWN